MIRHIHSRYKSKNLLLLITAAVAMLLNGCRQASTDLEKTVGRPPQTEKRAEAILIQPQSSCQEGIKEPEAKPEEIPECYRDIYLRAADQTLLGELDTVKEIVSRLGENGYTAVDYGNQADMVNPEKAEEFAGRVERKESGELMILCVMNDGGLLVYELKTAEGEVEAVQSTVSWKENAPEVTYEIGYPASAWSYSEDGYLFFEQSHMEGICFGHTAIRVKALDEACREWNRKYIKPVGYNLNNLFISDWGEADYGNLNFYDLYDVLYPLKYKEPVPGRITENGAASQIPESEFESVIQTYFSIEVPILREMTVYQKDKKTYEYRPRGTYDCGPGMDLPYPEAVACRENGDGTLTFTVNAVWPEEKTARAITHELTVRPLENSEFQYVSNRVIRQEENGGISWYPERLTKEQWENMQ